MKKLSAALIVLALISLKGNATTHIFNMFIGDIHRELCRYNNNGDIDSYAKGTWKLADDFILYFLNNIVKDEDVFTTLDNIHGGYGIISGFDGKNQKAYLIFKIAYSVDGGALEEPFEIDIYKLPNVNDCYLIFYSQAIYKDVIPSRGLRGSEQVSVTNFRIVRKISHENDFTIVAMFEKTNFISEVVRSGKYIDLQGNKMHLYRWSGMLYEMSYLKSSNMVKMTTYNFIPPNITTPTTFKIDWVFSPQNNSLTATTLHWMIHESRPQSPNEEPKMLETTIELNK